jgi:hypothetical protein
MTAAILHEMWALARPVSMKFEGQDKRGVDTVLEEFFAKSQDDPDAALQMFQEHPELSWRLNPEVNVVDKERLIAGHRAMDEIRQNMVSAVNAAYDAGRLQDPGVAKALMDDYRLAIAKLTDEQYAETFNPVYAKWYHTNQLADAIGSLGVLLPLAPADKLYKAGKELTDEEYQEIVQGAQAQFESFLEFHGLTPTDTQQTLYKMLRRDQYHAVIGKAKGQEGLDYTTWTEDQMVKWLARGGENGVFKTDRYLELVRDQKRREILGKGFSSSGTPGKSTPFLASLTPEEKAAIGWNSDENVDRMWYDWARKHWATREYLRENGISPTSKKGKAIWAQFENMSQEMAKENPSWGAELMFSREWMHRRLEILGVGTGTDKESAGWAEFLGIARDYHEGLDSTWNKSLRKWGVGPTAQAAFDVSSQYLPQVAALAKKNPQWWEAFRTSFTLRKFGFHWKMEDPATEFLWWGKKNMPGEEGLLNDQEDEDVWWEVD